MRNLMIVPIFVVCFTSFAYAKPDVHIGLGVWIYELRRCESGDLSKIVAQAQAAHLDHILVRVTSDGDKWAKFNPKPNVIRLTKALQAKNIGIYAWGYNYPYRIKSQVKLIKGILAMDFDGYVFNVETEFANYPTAAGELFSRVLAFRDAKYPDKLLGYSTFARVDRGTGARMPNAVFGQYCDVAMPQAYWRDFDWTPRTTAGRMCKAWTAMEHRWRDSGKEASIKPLIPTAHAYDGSGPTEYIPPVELANFLDAVKGYYGANIWTWQRMAPEHWKVLEIGPDQYLAKLQPQAAETASKPKVLAIATPPDVPEVKHQPWWQWLVKLLVCYLVVAMIIYLFLTGITSKQNEETRDRHMTLALVWPIMAIFGALKVIEAMMKKKKS